MNPDSQSAYVQKFEQVVTDDDSFLMSELDLGLTSQDLEHIVRHFPSVPSLPSLPALPPLPQLPQLQDSEETMDVSSTIYPPTWYPVSPRGRPSRDIIPDICNFAVEINGVDTHKKKYLYSTIQHRIYVNMGVEFPVQFSWDNTKAPGPMCVRATTVFSDEAQAEKRVERCVQHRHEQQNSDIPEMILQNVLHSARELHNTEGVYYCGNPEQADSWYSVVVYFPPNTQARHAYKFVCKNSCPNGINRRLIEVIFTLEDMNGEVYGRQAVGARVCSCPRRDLVRDEREVKKAGGRPGKRLVTVNRQEPKVKRVKLEASHDDDELVVTLPPVGVIGIRSVMTGLRVMLSMMEQVASLKNAELQLQYQQSIDALKEKIEELENINRPPAQ